MGKLQGYDEFGGNEPEGQGQQATDTSSMSVGAGSGSTVGGGGGGQPTNAQGSGSWTNLQSYTNANQDQANQMANQIKGNLDSARAGVGEDVKQSTTNYNNYLEGGTQQEVGRARGLLGAKQNALIGDESLYESGLSGVQSQDTNLNSYDPSGSVRAGIGNFEQRIKDTNTERGRLDELKRLQGSQATRGEGQLNQLLMQNNQQSRDMFEQQRGNADLSAQCTDQQKDAETRLNELRRVQGVTGELEQRISAPGYYNSVAGTAPTSLKSVEQQLAELGITPNTTAPLQRNIATGPMTSVPYVPPPEPTTETVGDIYSSWGDAIGSYDPTISDAPPNLY